MPDKTNNTIQTTPLFIAKDIGIIFAIMVLPSCNYQIDPNIQILINDQWIEVDVQTSRLQAIGVHFRLAIHFSKQNYHQAFDLENFVESQSDSRKKIKITNKKGEIFDIYFEMFSTKIFLRGDLQGDQKIDMGEGDTLELHIPDKKITLRGIWNNDISPSQPKFFLDLTPKSEVQTTIKLIAEECSLNLYKFIDNRIRPRKK